MSTSSRDVRTLLSALLLAVGVLLTTLGVVLLDLRQGLLTPAGVSRRAGVALADPRVSAFLADRATNAVLAAQPDLTAFKPVIAAVASTTVSSQAFQRTLQVSIRSAMGTLTSEGTSKIALSIPDLGVLVRSAVAQANPALAEKIPARVRGVIAELGRGKAPALIVSALRLSRRLAAFVALVLVLGILCIAGGFVMSRDRRRALLDVSINLVAAGVVLLVLRTTGGWFLQAIADDPLARGALGGAWAAFTAGLRAWALTLSLVGIVMAASAHSLLGRISVSALTAHAWRVAQDPPGGTWGRLARSLALIVLGVGAVLHPGAVIQWIMLAAGGLCAFLGIREALTLLQGRLASAGADGATPGAGFGRVAIVGLVTALLVAAAFFVMRPVPPPVERSVGLCNGSAALCDRPLDQVTFPGTAQLDVGRGRPGLDAPAAGAGDRGTVDGRDPRAPVRRPLRPARRHQRRDRSRFGNDVPREDPGRGRTGRRGSRGADPQPVCRRRPRPARPLPVPWILRAWRAASRSLVVRAGRLPRAAPGRGGLLVVEDYVTPQDLAAEFEKAGLADLVYRGSGRGPWPTLRTLIATNQRVVVMTESGRPGVAWILPAFDVMQETPYKFKSPADMTCAPNRGGTAGSLFLINNWIDTTPNPKPSNAAIVNGYDALLAGRAAARRSAACRPTILAVDFYRTGDVVKVARELNR